LYGEKNSEDELSDIEKLRLVDVILKDLDKPDPEIDRVWAVEARKRWAEYKAGVISDMWSTPSISRRRSTRKARARFKTGQVVPTCILTISSGFSAPPSLPGSTPGITWILARSMRE
jgi:hypothetical protein